MIDIYSTSLQRIDEKRSIIILKDVQEAVTFSADQFIHLAKKAIERKNSFAVALSGGSTPKAIFEKLVSSYKEKVDWKKVYLFFSDERNVDPKNSESNFFMAMQAGFQNLDIPSNQIFRMQAESDIQNNALHYEKIIQKHLGEDLFDLVMLGIGEDGHTASLFPNTTALNEKSRLVVANYIPQKDTWRMTLTYPCINKSKHISVYVLGKNKQEILQKIFLKPFPNTYPIENIGTVKNKALFITDFHTAQKII